jgi:tRNA (cytidine/uridine-2'-O-)-methyltransferase
MFHIVLFEPEIPPNTGNIIRLTANAGAYLHLIHPLGFDLNDKQLKRAGMDYRELSRVVEHESFENFIKNHTTNGLFAASTKGTKRYTNVEFNEGDTIVFGPETRGLPEDILNYIGKNNILRIPMQNNSRSLNLSNAVGVILYEALRQINFGGVA